jgi:hypothetical protein
LDLPAFYSEVVRVLKPHGALAAWGYDLNKFDNPNADKVMEDYYEGVLGPYWDEGRRKVEQHYRGMAWSRSDRFPLCVSIHHGCTCSSSFIMDTVHTH